MAFFAGNLSAEGYLTDLFHELDRLAVLTDDEFPLLNGDIGPDGGKLPAEHDFRSVLGNVDETAAADDIGSQAAYVDIALGIDLRHADASGIQAAAIIKIEHSRL